MSTSSYLQRRQTVLGRRILRMLAGRVQRDFARRLDEVVAKPPDTPRDLEASVYSYCGAASFLDQVVSLRSFLRGIGAPKKFVVVSDGTLTRAQKEHLAANHPSVECRELDELEAPPPPELAALVEEKMAAYYLARKLLLLTAISKGHEPALYTDSDVLFFPASDVSPLLDFGGELWYARDCRWSLDARLLLLEARDESAGIAPVNSGFCLFGREPEWDKAFEPLRNFEGAPEHVSEQTIIHNMMHRNGARELPTARFFLDDTDRGSRRDLALLHPAVMRHYVTSTRHKMWLHEREFYR